MLNFGLSMGRVSGTPLPPIAAGSYIWYNFDPTDGYSQAVNGSNLVEDRDTSGTEYDATVHGSNSVYLDGTTQSVELDIIHQLGVSIFDYIRATTNVTVIDHGDTTYTATGTSSNRFVPSVSPDAMKGETFIWSFDAEILSGSLEIDAYYDGSAWISLPDKVLIVNGANSVLCGGRDLSYMTLRSATTSFEIKFSNNTIEEITNTNSYITYTKPATGAIVTATPSGVTHIMTDSFQNFIATDVEVIQSDIDYMEANPNAFTEMMINSVEDVGLSFTIANVIHWYPANEGLVALANVRDYVGATTAVITDYTDTCRTTYQNGIYGCNDMRVIKDSSGRMTSTIDTTLARCDGTGAYADVGAGISGDNDFDIFIVFTATAVDTGNWELAMDAGLLTNRCYIAHKPGQALNTCTIQVGSTPAITLSHPAGAIHACRLEYTAIGSNLKISFDGQSPVSDKNITFDGDSTAAVTLGARNGGVQPHVGYLGEFVFTVDEVTDLDWQNFWTRVSAVTP